MESDVNDTIQIKFDDNDTIQMEFDDNDTIQMESDDNDLEDYEGASFDDAFNDLQENQTIEWPNDAYRDFMKLVNNYQLSNSAGNAIINFFNTYSNLDISPLP